MARMRLSSGARTGCAAGCPIASFTIRWRAWPGRFTTRGVRAGDRVAAVLPNMPETVVAMLASASLGATWCSCSPDFGVQGVVDRFVQIAPKVLFAVDGATTTARPTIPCKICMASSPRCQRSNVSSVLDTTRRSAVTGLPHLPSGTTSPRVLRPARSSSRASIRSPALYHVFVGYNRAAEVHRARCGRDAAATPQGARAAHRREARRPRLLLRRAPG